ncbi:hypothetical protein BABA_25016 [Neobacillus bataviensis LMG 21833]|uniref:Major facilitator superfamily (MFS) profile domain-containing protein n=1 Tax=Neobacillus bataviensis LMG 21833 TaxID=1117379 RepID=K6DPM3_9BACI|nr:MFS transporter [Neobacillus bataviensis]EKN62741.1 hypothetical protein BABA_25016 [Neobacillus bataviensis LMG 21833]
MDKQNSGFRWVVFASVLFTYFLMASQRTAPGLITDQVMRDFNVTASTIGLLTSIQFFAYTGLQIPFGILADRYGPNIFLISGAILTGIGTLIYSLGTNELMLFLARLLTGIGDATIWVNLVLILSQWFKVKEFVKLIGLAGMTGSLGFLLATVPFSAWIALLGWRAAFFSVGMMLCLCGLLLYFVLIKKPKQFFPTNSITGKKEIHREKPLILLRRIFSNRQAWALFFCHFGVVGAYVGFIGSWAVPYGIQVYGMTRSDASQLIMIGLIGALIGAPLTSWISSVLATIKRQYAIVHLTILLSWVAFLLFSGKPPFFTLYILFFIIGFGYGASALTFAFVRQSFSIKDSGVVTGVANTGGFLSAVLLPSIFGMVLDHFPAAPGSIGVGYFYGFITPVVFSLIGLMGVISIKETRQGTKHSSDRAV